MLQFTVLQPRVEPEPEVGTPLLTLLRDPYIIIAAGERDVTVLPHDVTLFKSVDVFFITVPTKYCVHAHFNKLPSIGSSGRWGGRGPRNMKSIWPPSAAIFFMTYLYRAGGGGGGEWPPRHPLDPLLLPFVFLKGKTSII